MKIRRALRLLVLGLISPLPTFLKRPCYSLLFGYRIGAGARIGFVLLDAQSVDLGPRTRIGHLNAVIQAGEFRTGEAVIIGTMNLFRGGERIELGSYATVMRFNVINAIPDHNCTTNPVSVLDLRAGAVVVSGHRIDFTDRVTIGRNVILGGRNSSLWTHSRQQTAPIEIGDFCYLGSEVRIAPGAALASECILGLGAVLTGRVEEVRSLVVGVPARIVRPLTAEDEALLHRKTREDMPSDFYGP